jgi:peptidoglycan/LPS O-acetylase OafA/YrhL
VSRAGGKNAIRSDALDGLRALAALSVLSYHVWLYRDDRPLGTRHALLDKVFFEANLGLICFFVLSGFLLYRPFAAAALTRSRRVDVRAYARRRIARIVPAYYACLIGCLLLYAAVGYSDITPHARLLPVFLVFGQNFHRETLMQIDPVTWTLCVEVAFYATLPALGFLALRLGPERRLGQAAVMGVLVAMTLAWDLVMHSHGWKDIAPKTLPAYIGHFALGMLAAMWAEGRRERGSPGRVPSAALMLSGWTLVLVTAAWHETELGSGAPLRAALANLPAAGGFALVVFAAAAGRGPAVGWLKLRPLAWVGLVSYGVYLWHLPLILAARQAQALPGALAPRLAVVLAVTLAVAAVSWYCVERPVIRWAARDRRPARRLRPADVKAAP